MIKLSVKDQKLLSELEKDSRNSLTSISKKIQLSKAVTHYRLQRLLNEKFITEFKALIDYYSLNYQRYSMLINLCDLKETTRNEIVDYLKSKNVDVKLFLQSRWDLELNIWVPNAKAFYNFYEEFLEQFSEFIDNKEFSLVTKIYYAGHQYITEKHDPIILGISEETEADEDLLKFIESKPRATYVEIAESLKIPVTTIQHRFKKLKNILKTTVPKLDVSQLSYNSFKINLILKNPSKKKEIIENLLKEMRVTQIQEFIGKTDLSFEADFQTTKELDGFLEKIRIDAPYISDFEVINIIG